MSKVAFLIANDEFLEDPPLRFTQNDAKVLKEILEDRESCGFEARIFLNETSQKVRIDLDYVSEQLTQDDTLLFYYSGHGKLHGSELYLVSKDTTLASLRTTSIQAQEVLRFLRSSYARRRVLILDCCHSGQITNGSKGDDVKGTLNALSHSFGTYILSASTAIQNAKEREKDGHGVFTKALIDCLREGRKESITITDLYDYARARLSSSESQTPLLTVLQQEGVAIEIGNFKEKHKRKRQEALTRLIATARGRLNALRDSRAVTQGQADSLMRILICDEAALLPQDWMTRNNFIRYLNEEEGFDFARVLSNVPPAPTENLPSSTTPSQYSQLVGAWEGSLRWIGEPHVDFRVLLVIAKCHNSALKGILYYEGFDIKENYLVYRGMDELQEDTDIKVDRKHNRWKLEFQRKIHEVKFSGDNLGDQLQTMTSDGRPPPRYQWDCEIGDIDAATDNSRASTRMSVEMKRLPGEGTQVWTGFVFML